MLRQFEHVDDRLVSQTMHSMFYHMFPRCTLCETRVSRSTSGTTYKATSVLSSGKTIEVSAQMKSDCMVLFDIREIKAK